MKAFISRWPWIVGCGVGLVYGLVLQLWGRSGWAEDKDLYVVMSLGYVVLLPLVMGALTVATAPEPYQRKWGYRIFAPWLTVLAALACSFTAGWEGGLCLAIMGITCLPLASLGGIAAGLYLEFVKRRSLQGAFLTLLAVLPGASPWMEARYPLEKEFQEARASIEILADRETVWRQVTEVRRIQEPVRGVVYLLGMPRPVEAKLSRPGRGGVRFAKWERGLEFVERVDGWKPGELFSFSIQADPRAIPLTTLDEHVTVGGRYFDVVHGAYSLEALENGATRLSFSSQYRVSTRYNAYALVWAKLMMLDIQYSILRVMKARCEA